MGLNRAAEPVANIFADGKNTEACVTVRVKGCRRWQSKDAFCWQRFHSAEVNLIRVGLIRLNCLRKKATFEQSARRVLPEAMAVVLRCRWVNCVRIFNQTNHDDGLMSVSALIWTALLKYYVSGPSSRAETSKWTEGSFSENMKAVVSNTHICIQLFQSFQAGSEQQPHVCVWKYHTEKNINRLSWLMNIWNWWEGLWTPKLCSPDESIFARVGHVHVHTCMYSRWTNDHLKSQIQSTIQEQSIHVAFRGWESNKANLVFKATNQITTPRE